MLGQVGKPKQSLGYHEWILHQKSDELKVQKKIFKGIWFIWGSEQNLGLHVFIVHSLFTYSFNE